MTLAQKQARGRKAMSKGKKRPFTQEQVQLIRLSLKARSAEPGGRGSVRQLALLEAAISTCLRASDLLALKVSDLPMTVGSFPVQQQKTNRVVSVRLTAKAFEAVWAWIRHENLGPGNLLFDMTRETYGDVVKSWARIAHLDPRYYSTHSMRRTMPAHLYHKTNNVKAASELLGHANITHTGAYLGVETDAAHKLAGEHDI